VLIKDGDEMDSSKEGGLRLLTTGEIELAKSVFRTTIKYHKVWIHLESYLPFGMQDDHTAMTPNGEIYFRMPLYRNDFSQATDDMQHLFVHEMSHVWQVAKGMSVIIRGMVSEIVSYRYQLDSRLLSEYPMEQQAQIIADNFILENSGYNTWLRMWNDKLPGVTLDGSILESEIRQQYKNTLRGFPW